MNKTEKNLTEKELIEYGRTLAETLTPGSIIALTGNLGAGKTTLTRAIGEGLGVNEHITSPTFTLIHEYDSGRLPLYHFDVYRIEDVEEMEWLGYEEYFFGKGVCVVEWAEKVESLLPENTIRIQLSPGNKPDERILRAWS
jgi:tRNA threonylcarbamoyladenosine biosynthesis protein TsaE